MKIVGPFASLLETEMEVLQERIAGPDELLGALRGAVVAPRRQPKPCPCHGLAHVVQGHRAANGAARTGGPTMADVTRRSGVSTGTVSVLLNRPERVPDATRTAVLAAVAGLGYVRGGVPLGKTAPHWRRTGFATWLFHPAATGWYSRVSPHAADAGAGYPGDPDGRTDGSRRRLGSSALLPRHGGHADSVYRGAH